MPWMIAVAGVFLLVSVTPAQADPGERLASACLAGMARSDDRIDGRTCRCFARHLTANIDASMMPVVEAALRRKVARAMTLGAKLPRGKRKRLLALYRNAVPRWKAVCIARTTAIAAAAITQ